MGQANRPALRLSGPLTIDMFCSKCGVQLPEDVSYCSRCGASVKPSTVGSSPVLSPVQNQKYGMPALLSFFLPGLGQLVKGQVGKAILIFIGGIIFFLLAFVYIGIPFLIVLWLWQIYDAYNSRGESVGSGHD